MRQCVPRWNCVVASWKPLSWLPGGEDTAALAQAGFHRHTIASLLEFTRNGTMQLMWMLTMLSQGVFKGSSYALNAPEQL